MPRSDRPRVAPTDDWQQLSLLATFPEQRAYELIRPVVLFGASVPGRARETGTAERTLYRQAARFAKEGMAGLTTPPKEPHRRLPPQLHQQILDLKAENPAFRPHEIATICEVRFGRRPSPHTVKRILAEGPTPVRTSRRYPPYHEIADPAERRLAVIRLHAEGWAVKSIAAYLGVGKRAVYRTLRRWVDEGVLGLDDKPHARKDGPRKVTLRAITAVKELQENPRLGAFRVAAALRQQGIVLSPATCGRILAKNRALYGLSAATPTERTPKPHPYLARRRHEIWTVDIRYLDHNLGDFKVYSISILEHYSRAILASARSRRQDLTAFLMVLYAAIRQHGAPEVLVSDGGAVFRATQALAVYERLGIRKEQIERRQPWQSLIEANFGVQARMADWDFAKAATWADLLAVHEQWVANSNYQMHWTHRQGEDGRQSPAVVLGWVTGRWFTDEELRRAFYSTRFGRRLSRTGYCRFRHWRIYGEQGLAGEQVALWLYAEQLTVSFRDEPLAEYRVHYQPDRRHFRDVTDPHLYETPFRSPQLPLFALGEADWLKVLRAPEYRPPRPRRGLACQLPLLDDSLRDRAS